MPRTARESWRSATSGATAPCGTGRLEPQARCLIEDIDGGEPRELSGRELLESGLKVTAANPQTALLLTCRRQP